MDDQPTSALPETAIEGAESQAAEDDPFIRGLWYVALPSSALKPGQMAAHTFLNEPILFARRKDGSVFAIKDLCPHRGIPLRFGQFDGETIGCAYHGWRFDGTGTCTEIPSLVSQDNLNLSRIRCGTYEVRERQGLIWLFIPDPKVEADAAPPEPELFPRFEESDAKAAIQLVYNANFDDSAFGMMDPAHIPFVHRAWWLKRKQTDLKLKEKHFEPFGLGWRMKPHAIPNLTPFHRLLGKNVTTEIQLRLPGFRIELIYGDKHSILNLLAITPIDNERTQMLQAIWWSMPGLDFLSSTVAAGAKRFLNQDADIINKQNEGLAHGRRQMLVPDADSQMKWWLQLKKEWRSHRHEGRAFQNAAPETTLRFRS